MRLFAFSVYDSAAEVFGRPFFVPSRGVAIRSFRDEVNNAQSELNKHPGDYTLYALGSFDDNVGEFETGRPEQVLRAQDCIVKE